MENINAPKGDRNFPYWPPIQNQRPQLIPGQMMAGEVEDIRINKSMYMLPYQSADIRKLNTPEALQDTTGASWFIEKPPTMGRGAGVGLFDMLNMSIAQVNAQGKV